MIEFAIIQGEERIVKVNAETTQPYLLIRFANRYTREEQKSVFLNLRSEEYPVIRITDTGGYAYPLNLEGETNLDVVGIWRVNVFAQSSSTNTDTDLSDEYLGDGYCFVEGNESTGLIGAGFIYTLPLSF